VKPSRVVAAGYAAALVATWMALAAGSVAAASPDCVAVAYSAGLSKADGLLHAVPPQPGLARVLLSGLVAGNPSAHAVLDPVIADLDAAAPDLNGAQQRLDTLSATLALPAGSTCHIDSGAARTTLHDVYASNVFANLDQNSEPSVLGRIGQGVIWVLTHIGDALRWLVSHVSGALGIPGTIALGLIILLVAVALAWWRLRAARSAPPARQGAEPATSGTDPDVEWRIAEHAAGRGEYREAIRRAFRSALLQAVGRGRLHVDAAWTTRELLASVTADGDLLAVLAPAAALFDHAWYSGDAIGANEWERARVRCAAVRDVARGRRAAAPMA
jgi:hypothetical protein